MKNSNKQYAQALYLAIQGLKGEKLSKTLKQFAGLLALDHKLSQADQIISEFVKFSKKQEGIIEMEVESARRVDIKILEKIEKIFGGEIEVTEKINPDILGGLIIKTEDRILDFSLKTQLLNLKQNLI